jgi:hypothetical protein
VPIGGGAVFAGRRVEQPVAPQSITGTDTSQADANHREHTRGRCAFSARDSGSKTFTIATRTSLRVQRQSATWDVVRSTSMSVTELPRDSRNFWRSAHETTTLAVLMFG